MKILSSFICLCIFINTLSFSTIKNQISNTKLKTIASENFNDLITDAIDEVATPKQLKVIGNIPVYVKGLLIRNGPGLFGSIDKKKKRGRFTHVFDGLSKLTKYDINSNNVTFQTKFLKSKWYDLIVKQNEDIPPFLTAGPLNDTNITLLKKIRTFTQIFQFDNTPVNIHQIGDESGPWITTTDAPMAVSFDPITLDTYNKISYNQSILSNDYIEFTSTSHPHKRYTKNNQVYTYNYILALKVLPFNKSKPKTIACIVRTDSSLNRLLVGTVPFTNGDKPYIHDFSITDKYVILFIYPLYLNNELDNSFISQLMWKDDEPTKIYIFDVSKYDNIYDNKNDLSNEAIAYYEAPTMFSYHHINAYEEENHIVVDVVGYDDAKIVGNGFLNMFDPEKRKLMERDGRTYRYRLPLPSKLPSTNPIIVKHQVLEAIDSTGLIYTTEFNRINPKFSTKKYRYTYGSTGFASPEKPYCGGYLDWGIVKQDLYQSEQIALGLKEKSQTCLIWKRPNSYTSEPVFVPDPNGIDEDDGVLLVVVYDTEIRDTYLLVLNAKTMIEIARCYTEFRVPMTFHGDFIPYTNF